MQSEIIFVATFPPRECGIATFTKDLSDSIRNKFGNKTRIRIVAMEDAKSGSRVYPKKIFLKINEGNIGHYAKAAKKINSMKRIKIVNIQHEFGIFGGEMGRHLIKFMELLDKKTVLSFHSVIERPDEKRLRLVQRLVGLSDKVVVMTGNAKEILCNFYSIPADKIEIIPHGVPSFGFSAGKERTKKKFGLIGKKVLMTFGMLSRGKALECVIKAIPEVIKKHPDAVYLIVGKTHPKVIAQEGESYRNELKAIVNNLGIRENVKFVDKYLTLHEIVELLTVADVYLAPSLDKKQICSGTVSYALGAGKAIIASMNRYNEEVLSGKRGIIVENNSSREFAKNILLLLSDGGLKLGFEKRAFEYSRNMAWPNVSTKYFNIFENLAVFESDYFSKLPKISFRHLFNLTDDFGIIQFADFIYPIKDSGYTLDDNARALSVAISAYDRFKSKRLLRAADTYLSFVEQSQTDTGFFHNIANADRVFVDKVGSEDSFGRAVNSLGRVLKSTLPKSYKLRAKNILGNAFENDIISPRAQADTLIGLSFATGLMNVPINQVNRLINSLISKFEVKKDGDWTWFENYLTYGNSVLSEALFEAEVLDKSKKIKDVAMASLDFLTKTHFIDGKLVPVGQEGWFHKNGSKSLYDQQPIEAAGMTSAYLKAFNSTKKFSYLKNARKSFEWFLGRNVANQVIYDESTGGCFDGLTKNGVNMNQGAESTICYLNARLSIH